MRTVRCILCALVMLSFSAAVHAVQWHNWRFPYYRIASEMDLVSSAPSAMFWDDLGAAPVFDSALWPDSAAENRNHWALEPGLSFGALVPREGDSLGGYGFLGVRNDVRYRNLLVRQTLHADKRYDDDPLFPAHPDRIARGRIEEAYAQLDWRYAFLRFGRAMRNWGPFADRSLVVSTNPYSYDALEWGVHSSLFEFRHLVAGFVPNSHTVFSASPDNQPGRFFAVHALNVMFGKWATVGMLESMIFRRDTGFPDFQYLNPFSIYSVLNTNQEGAGNLMLGFQWKIRPYFENVSLKGQLLIDDIQVDSKVAQDQEPNHWAVDAGLYWHDALPLPLRHLFKAGYQRCSEWIYTVSDNDMNDGQGYTYLSKGLGWPKNDGDNLFAGFSIIGKNFWAATAAVNYARSGDKNVTSWWYDTALGYTGLPYDWRLKQFPSGIVEKNISFVVEGMAYLKDYADLRLSIANQWMENKGHVQHAFEYKPRFAAELGFHFSDFSVRLPD